MPQVFQSPLILFLSSDLLSLPSGTILASSGSDGTVKMWKCTFYGKWACLSVVGGVSDEKMS
jgi:WD40 repeat protein